MSNLIPHWVHQQFAGGKRCGRFPAASLFVDISGFVPLTEALMRHRRDGAEVLAETLEAIFAPLVGEVYARGGLIPLFAGDAFSAIFPAASADSPQAALQALCTAFAIQRTLLPGGQERVFPTKYGDFAIGVKVGLSWGWVHWGVPGKGGRYTYYFRGPAVDGCARAEQRAERGEILADRAILPFLQGHVTAEATGDATCLRLTHCTLDLPTLPVDIPPLSAEECRPFLPRGVLELTARAEFREVCPVFVSFEEPGQVAALHTAASTTLALCERYGGGFYQTAFGDKGGLMVILFGAPLAYENNVERAAEFLLALADLTRSGTGLSWRAGMAFGTAWAGIRGGTERSEYGALGDVMNLAARLALRAEWGEIWASAAVHEQIRESHLLEELGTFSLKGKQDPVPVYRLMGPRRSVGRTLYAGTMVGREAELAGLCEFLRPILGPSKSSPEETPSGGRFAGVAAICGDAGTGKSRLAYEVQQRMTSTTLGDGVNWFFCPTDEILRQSLNPFKHVLRRYFDQSSERSPEQNRARFDEILDDLIAALQLPGSLDRPAGLEILSELERTRSFLGALVGLHWPDSLYEQVEPKLRFENTLLAFKMLVLAESLRRPVVLQLEDLHWLDADSRELVKVLVRGVESYPLAILCTSRYRDDGSRVSLETDRDVPQYLVELTTLSPPGVRQLARQVLGGEVTDGLVRFLTEKTGGNPFFVEQLLLNLRERGALERAEAGRWTLGVGAAADVPMRIGAVLIARLDRLAGQIKEVVQTAAVLGREFEVQILSQILRGEEDLFDRIEQAQVERIWLALSEMRYLFRHAMMRDAAYGMQLRSRLRRLHHLAAEAIERVYSADLLPYYPDLAYHTNRAEIREGERHYARLAGEAAAAQFANDRAVEYLSRALELTPAEDLAARYGLLLTREQVYDLQGTRDVQRSDLAELQVTTEGLGDDQKRAEVALRRANYAEAVGDFPGAEAAAQEVVRLAEGLGAPSLESVGRLRWGRALWRQGNNDAAWGHVERALALARQAGDRQAEADSRRGLGAISFFRGDYAQSQGAYEACLRLYRELGDRRGVSTTLNNLGNLFAAQEDHERARDYFSEALGIYREIGDRLGESTGLGNLGALSEDQHDYAAARAYYERSLRLVREIGDPSGEGWIINNLGVVYRNLGQYDRARACYEEALQIYRSVGDRPGEGLVLLNLGLAFHRLGDDEAAREYSQQALAVAQELGARSLEAEALTNLGYALMGVGCREEAEQSYRRALDIRRELGARGAATEPLAGLARGFLASGALEQAQACVEEILPCLETHTLAGTEEPFLVYLTCYQVMRAAQDRRADDLLDTAHRLLQQWAGRLGDQGMRQSFLEQVWMHREIVREWEDRWRSRS